MSEGAQSELGLCDHCGMPLKTGTMRATVASRLQSFCCYGCFLCQKLMGAEGTDGSSGFALARMAMAWLLGGPVMALSLIEYVDGFGNASESTLALVYWLIFGLATAIVGMIGLPYLWVSLSSLIRGRVGSDLLIAIGALSAYGYSSYWLFFAPNVTEAQPHLYFDSGSMVLVLVSLGKYIEAAARRKTTGSLSELSAHVMAKAIRISEDKEIEVAAADLVAGDVIKILPGAVVPADAEIIEGESEFSEALLTGEFRPVKRGTGELILAASANGEGLILARVTRAGNETTAARIVALAKEALSRRTKMELAVDRVARFFIPFVLLVACGSVLFQMQVKGLDGVEAARIALSVLVVACPCALGLATPLSVAIAIHRGAEMGMLFRSGEAIERLAAIRKLYLDKTGTITTGAFAIVSFDWRDDLSEEGRQQASAALRALESGSEHWIGKAIHRHFKDQSLPETKIEDIKAIAGQGIEGTSEGEHWWALKSVGKRQLPDELATAEDAAETCVFFGVDDKVLARIALADQPKANATGAIRSLRILGLELAMVTGDRREVASKLAQELGIQAVHAEVLPDEKLALIEAEKDASAVGMSGDGVNDGPALMAAGVGVTFQEASGLAKLAAGVTLVGKDLGKLPNAVVLARRTQATIRLNLFWAFSYNIGAIGLAFFGLLSPEVAALAMLGSSVFVVTRSWKLYRFGDTALRASAI